MTYDRTVTANTPGTNSGVTTNSAGYTSGSTSLTLAATGTGAIYQGDSLTITGDSTNTTYIAQNDILDVSIGGVLSISPGLAASLSAATHAITSSAAANQFTVAIPNDSLTVTF